jgi:hypothetical protein
MRVNINQMVFNLAFDIHNHEFFSFHKNADHSLAT